MNDFDVMCDFDVIVDSNLQNLNRVHPLKQKDVDVLVTSISKDTNIKCIIIYGSALDLRCRSFSDLDVYVETYDKDKSIKLPYDDLDTEVDLTRDISHTSRLYKEIDRTGLLILGKVGENS